MPRVSASGTGFPPCEEAFPPAETQQRASRGKESERFSMLPLSFAKTGDTVLVVRVGGNDAARQHLSDLGFVPGAVVRVVSSHNGDLIVVLKDTRLAITREMAEKVMTNDETGR